MHRGAEGLGYLAIGLGALLACKEGAPAPSGPDPRAICDKLVVAGVAKNCSDRSTNWAGTGVSFDVVGVADDPGTIDLFVSDEVFKQQVTDITSLEHIDPADYPAQYASSPKDRISVRWGPRLVRRTKTELDTLEGVQWQACRADKPVALCAKAQPKYYAAYKALFEASKRIVGGS